MIYAYNYVFIYVAAGSILPGTKSPKSMLLVKLLLKLSSSRWLKDSKFNNTVFARSLPSTCFSYEYSAAFITLCSRDAIFLKFRINSTIARIYPL